MEISSVVFLRVLFSAKTVEVVSELIVVVSCVDFSNTALVEEVSGTVVTSLTGLVVAVDVVDVTGSMLIAVLSETVIIVVGFNVFFSVVASAVVIGSEVVFSCAKVLRTFLEKKQEVLV